MWGSTGYTDKTSSDELRKHFQRVLEKYPSGVMGRDLKRIYKDVIGKELPVQDFQVQRPIELVEKELADVVYYTRCVRVAKFRAHST
jgi:hypothetical protein